jgi:hypothetical protein
LKLIPSATTASSAVAATVVTLGTIATRCCAPLLLSCDSHCVGQPMPDQEAGPHQRLCRTPWRLPLRQPLH